MSVEAGERVIVGIASANRDAAAHGDGDAFVVGRDDPRTHYTFGFGAHFCLGAPVARLEIETAVNVLMDLVTSIELAPGFEMERLPAFWTYGLRHLPVVLG